MVNAFMKIHNGKKAKSWAGSILPIQRCDSFIELSFGPICLFFPQRTSAQFYCARFILLWIIVTQSGIRVSLCATSTINHRKNGPLFFVLFSRRMMLVPWFSLFFFCSALVRNSSKSRKKSPKWALSFAILFLQDTRINAHTGEKLIK